MGILAFLSAILGAVFLICLIGNLCVRAVVRDERWQVRLALLVVPFLPAVVAYFWIYPGLMPWNAAGAIMLYPLFHVVFVLASAVSLLILEKIRFRSPPPS
ncbi:hypothetical protein KYN89_14135 [Alteriqipengyuania sp. NZ-12B]|uniref:Uncharacterized protein n=1 Tax=Alteriqipengyuania abyssalis TaxID=2860200 RepID=A0ABS7PGS9_9SPHN|nr:hypothetical protein [Alteriqipengyuania abyssalis]MBY8338186.1 hypothetical protein [Alteriqipengyuania abyssalis]